MLKQLLQSLGKFYYWPNNGNLGDLLIAEATRQYFQTLGLKWEEFIAECPPQERDITIVYGGGGRFTPHWPGLEYIVDKLTASYVKRCIVLPHSFTNVDTFVQAMDERHTLICREQRSYEYCCSLRTKAQILLGDDMALLLNLRHIQPTGKTTQSPVITAEAKCQRRLLKNGWSKRVINGVKKSTIIHQGKRVAFLLRTDCEKQSCFTSPYSYDLSIAWGASCHATPYNATFIRTFAEALRYPDSIVTDRLHVGIMGYLLGKEVYLLDNDYGKLSGVYDKSLKNADNVHLLSHDKLTPVLQHAWEAFNAPDVNKPFIIQEPEYIILRFIAKLQKKYKKVTFFSKVTWGKKRMRYMEKKNQLKEELDRKKTELTMIRKS